MDVNCSNFAAAGKVREPSILDAFLHSELPAFIQQGGKIVDFNPAFEKLTRFTSADLLEKDFTDLIFTDDRLLISKLISASLKRETFPQKLEYRLQKADGSLVPVIQLSICTLNASGIDYLLAFVFDNSLEFNLKISSENYRENLEKALHSIQDALVICNLSMRIIFCNQKFLDLFAAPFTDLKDEPLSNFLIFRNFRQSPEVTGQNENVDLSALLSELIRKKEKIEFSEWLLELSEKKMEIEGTFLPFFNERNEVCGFTLHFSELESKKLLEREKLKFSQLEALGQLAGGIAHDFNNLLMAMMGNITIIKEELKDNPRLTKRLADCEAAAYKARDLTQQLLTFSRGGTPKKEILNINQLIQEVTEFCLHGSNVRAIFDLQPKLWTVEADESQLRQVVQNIVINADQAMLKGGNLMISAKNHEQQTDSSLLKKGRYILISFSDEGYGIPPEILSRIFDPYFTTKPMGSGLGLSIVYSILKKHNGAITVRSTPQKGSTFDVYIPAAESEKKDFSEIKTAENNFQKNLKVLLMDDEELILDVTSEMLQIIGCEVKAARDGIEALALFNEAISGKAPFDVLILDLTIPGGLGGKDVLQEILKIDPNARAIVASGYCNEDVLANCQQFGFRTSLLKPFKLEELKNSLQRAIQP